jgi:hypothetical protein
MTLKGALRINFKKKNSRNLRNILHGKEWKED